MKGGLTSIYVSRNLPVCLGLAGLGFLPPGLCVFGGGRSEANNSVWGVSIAVLTRACDS